MDAPVTRRELREELATLESRLDEELALWGGALREEIREARAEARAENARLRAELTAELTGEMDKRHAALATDLARHARAIMEHVSAQVAIVDERYKDLRRVAALEAKRRPPIKRTRRRSRRRPPAVTRSRGSRRR